MTLGNVSQMYSLLPDRIQAHVSKEFPCVTEGALANMLSYLTFIRNVSAHNERLYDFGANQSKSIPDMPIHSALKIGKKGKMYKYGKRDLFAAIVCLKYLLPNARFERLIVDIDREIEILLSKTHRVQKAIYSIGWVSQLHGEIFSGTTDYAVNSVQSNIIASPTAQADTLSEGHCLIAKP